MNARAIAELRAERARLKFTPEALCFGPQLRAVRSPPKRKVLKCGRRSGKTTAVAIKLLLEAQQPPVVPVLYVTLTRMNAKEIIWGDLLDLNERFKLGGTPNLTDLTLYMPNGGEIKLRGANNERETAKIRGKKFKFCAVDEAQSIPDRILSPLMRDILGPTLLDYGGELWQVGTPPPVRAGIFFESYAGKLAKSREQHGWTIRENERLPARLAGKDVDEILRSVREEYGWGEEEPTYLREYLGQDIEDLEALLYAWRDSVCTWIGPQPTGKWHYIFGVDIGFDDSDAIAVLGWREGEKRVYLVDEAVAAERDVTDLANAIKAMQAKYNPLKIVIDQGGGGKKTVAELVRRHGLSLEPAEKSDKSGFIRLMNADMRKGNLLARADSIWAGDCKLVRKDFDAMAREGGKLQELSAKKGGFHSDICDAVLYGWRACYGWAERIPEAKATGIERELQRLDEWERSEGLRIEAAQRRGWLDDTDDAGWNTPD